MKLEETKVTIFSDLLICWTGKKFFRKCLIFVQILIFYTINPNLLIININV